MRFLALLFLLPCTCLFSQENIDEKLEEAEALLDSDPDAALEIVAGAESAVPCHPRALFVKSRWLLMQSRFAEADSTARKGLPCSRQRGDLASEGKLLGIIAASAIYAGQLDTGIHYFQKSLDPLGQSGDSVAFFKSKVNLGASWLKAGQPEKALQLLQEGGDYFWHTGDTSQALATWLNTASSLEMIGQSDSSWSIFQQIEPLAGLLADFNEGQYWLNYGINAEGQGEFEKSLECYEKAAASGKRIGNRRLQLAAMVNRGITASVMGKDAMAVDLLEKAVDSLQADGVFIDLEANAHEVLYPVYVEKGSWEKAFHSYVRFRELNDKLVGENKQQAYAEIEAKYQKAELEKQVALQDAELQQRKFWNWLGGGAALALGVLSLLLWFFLKERDKRLSLARENEAMLEERNEELQKMNEELSNKDRTTAENDDWENKQIRLNNKEGAVLRLGDLLCVQALAGGVQYTTMQGNHFNWQKLKSASELLPGNVFVPVSRSAIVNRFAVRGMKGNVLQMENGASINVGNTYLDEVRKTFNA